MWIIGEKYAGRKYMPYVLDKIDSSVKELRQYFSWFNEVFSSVIGTACADFWHYNPQIRLFSLEKNSKNFVSGNKYFVTQAQIHSVKYSLRLSDTICDAFLSEALGKIEEEFSFDKMTELEANIISKFNKILFEKLKDNLLSAKEISNLLDREENFDTVINLGFILYQDNSDFEMGKIFLSIPQKLIKFPQPPEIMEVLDVTKFKKAQTPVDIFVGKTKLSLDDINHLEQEDIVVLENSDIKKMAIIAPTEFSFNVNPDPRLFIKEDDDEDIELQKEDIMSMAKDIWDNVQVDVCAKFPQVKMSLGELREMSEGVVVELDSIYGNEVTLEVENKNVAKGELVIVGYKYGVRITEIFSQAEPVEQETYSANESNNNDDFDVNDFEIEE